MHDVSDGLVYDTSNKHMYSVRDDKSALCIAGLQLVLRCLA